MSPEPSTLRWGILGAGAIAAEFADGLRASRSGVLHAVASRGDTRARDFGARYGARACHGSYDALLADPDVDVVYVATPHPMHARWAVAAADAGKHVLCEKPLTVNAAGAGQVVDAAARNGVFLMEAFMYRLHPQTERLVELLRRGVVGEVRAVSAAFGFDLGPGPGGRATDHELGGGGILDVGCYCVSVARLVAATALGVDHPEPEAVTGLAHVDPADRVDHVAMGTLRFAGGLLAEVSCGVTVRLDDAIRVHGSEGTLVVPRPAWLPEHRRPGTSVLVVERGGRSERVEVAADRGVFSYEADHVAEHVQAGQSPLLPWAETLANMRTLDRWRAAAGVRFDFESEEAIA